ncbi:MAG: PQQ-binding-like beta-propeller repeat protein [Planctomycetaceae bacterium]|nr:PQQ-binding-like beta-propeller repeat protein [Planctomycetaceae bacterium]
MTLRVAGCQSGLLLFSILFCTSCTAQVGDTESNVSEANPSRVVVIPQTTATAAPTTDWSRFRGPAGDGSSSAVGLPADWDSSTAGQGNLIWKTPLAGAGASSPIVWQDHIYLTSYTGYFVPGEPMGSLDDLKRHVLCFDRTSGELLWDREFAAKLPEEERIRDHGYAANTPVADADGLYVFLGKSGVVALTHSGEDRWQADVGSGTNGWGTAASPVLYDDLVLVNASVESESLVALDQKSGEERWRVGGMKESWNTPQLVRSPGGDDELVMAIFGKVLGLAPATGKQLWSCNTDITWYMVPSIVAGDGVAYSLGGRSGVAGLAVKTGGQGDVTASRRLWTSNKGSNVPSPVYQDGHLYWTHDKLGIAYCAKAESGELAYEERLNRCGDVYASALLADGKVYYINREGRVFVVAAKPEFELLATNEMRDGGQFNASPAVDGQRLLIRSDKFLYCIGK